MVKALESLMQQRSKFDYILIETTGLANPGPVAAALWTDAELESSICLDAIVTVVDSKNILRHLHEKRKHGIVNEAQQQVAFADIILINKIDLVNEKELSRIEEEIAKINSEVQMVRCHKCELHDIGCILHTGLYTSACLPAEYGNHSGRTSRSIRTDGDRSGHGHAVHEMHDDTHDAYLHACSGAECNHDSHRFVHDPSVRTVTLRTLRPVDLQCVRHWLDELLWEETGRVADDDVPHYNSDNDGDVVKPDIYRVKGLLWLHDSNYKYIIQGVHEIYDVIQGPLWIDDEPERYCKVVFIGRHLDGYILQKGLDECMVELDVN